MRTLSPRLNLGKLILALALLSAIIALANTLLASYRVQRDQLVGNTLEANRVYATKLAETTQNFLLAAQQELAYAATRLGQGNLDPAQAQDEASRLQLQTNSFNSSLVVDADGLVIATSPQTLQLQGEVLHSVGNNAALAARQPMISDPYQSATGKLLVSLSHPIFDRQGTTVVTSAAPCTCASAAHCTRCWASTTTVMVPTCTWSIAMAACCTTPMASGWATTWSATPQ